MTAIIELSLNEGQGLREEAKRNKSEPIQTKALGGMDSLLSIVQMPAGIPVATMAINGAKNAGLFAAQILALTDEALAAKLDAFRAEQTQKVLDATI